MTLAVTPRIAETLNLSESELYQQALESLLHEKRRQALQLRLDILARYRANSLANLEALITRGAVAEHPAWEDLIVVENLSTRLEQLDDHLDSLQYA